MLPVNRSLNASLKWLLSACSTRTDGLPSIVPTPSLMALPDRLRPVPTKIVADRVPSTPCACAAATGAMAISTVAARSRFNVKSTPFGRSDGHPSAGDFAIRCPPHHIATKRSLVSGFRPRASTFLPGAPTAVRVFRLRQFETNKGPEVLSPGWRRCTCITEERFGLHLGEGRQQELTTERVFDHDSLGIARRDCDHGIRAHVVDGVLVVPEELLALLQHVTRVRLSCRRTAGMANLRRAPRTALRSVRSTRHDPGQFRAERFEHQSTGNCSMRASHCRTSSARKSSRVLGESVSACCANDGTAQASSIISGISELAGVLRLGRRPALAFPLFPPQ